MAIQWTAITAASDIEHILSRSNEVPCLIFKHSTSCNISAIAKYRLEDDWRAGKDELEPYYLDLLRYRGISNQLAETFNVYHESPQVLLISGGECIYDASHLDISVEELTEALNAV
ncbi:MAG TPA: bacillithiol system redox-active protein YtxJ [Saprospiraceae bacterium]|jgi:bacillithiol system protein YtxJ|nr:bacillithiol system redox-active protein YtxJ [Saprospiraceae bacterium]HPI07141.1 bacillithiol system redox-active protein YtxJ [Saprospiraceae bacterium]